MITVADDLMEVRDLLQQPLQRQLQDHTVLLSLQRFYALRNKQFQISDKNYFLRPKELRPTEQDELLNVDDYSVPVKITVRDANAGPDDPWLPVQNVNFDDFELQRLDGAPVISIYGTPPRIAYSLDVTDQVFTLWYEPSANRPQLLTETPEIETDFNTLLVYDATIECGARVRNQSEEYKAFWKDQLPVYAAASEKWEEVMKKWMNMGRQQGRTYKRTFPFRRTRESFDYRTRFHS